MEAEQSIGVPSDTSVNGSRGRQIALGAAGGLALAVVLWGGYSHHWPWTGINGGTATLWDWLNLLFLPLLLPTVILPALKPIATGRVVYLDQDGRPIERDLLPVRQARRATITRLCRPFTHVMFPGIG